MNRNSAGSKIDTKAGMNQNSVGSKIDTEARTCQNSDGSKTDTEMDMMEQELDIIRYEIEFKGISDREELHDLLQEALSLPDYYGRNLDALYDCLMELPVCMVSLCHVEDLVALDDYGQAVTEVFETAAMQNLRMKLIYVTDDEEEA